MRSRPVFSPKKSRAPPPTQQMVNGGWESVRGCMPDGRPRLRFEEIGTGSQIGGVSAPPVCLPMSPWAMPTRAGERSESVGGGLGCGMGGAGETVGYTAHTRVERGHHDPPPWPGWREGGGVWRRRGPRPDSWPTGPWPGSRGAATNVMTICRASRRDLLSAIAPHAKGKANRSGGVSFFFLRACKICR